MKHYLILCIALAGLFASACQKDAELPESRKEAFLMVYNGSADFYDLNSWVLVNNEAFDERSYNDNGAGLVGAFNFSYYSPIDTGLFRIAFTDPAEEPQEAEKITESLFHFEDKKHYTLYLTDSMGYSVILHTDDEVERHPSRARIRLINLSPDAGKVFLTIDNIPVEPIRDVTYRQVTGFTDLEPNEKPGIRIMTVDQATGLEKILTRKSFALEAGKCYTMILRGYTKAPDGNINKTLTLSTITNF